MQIKTFLFLLFLSATCMTLAAQHEHVHKGPPYIPKTLRISGEVEHNLELSVDDLKKRTVMDKKDFPITTSPMEGKSNLKSFKGILLRELLEEAKIKMPNPKEKGKFYIVASAPDEYKVIFAWNEIFNNENGDNVFVVFEESGKPIEDEGPIILITAHDIKPGPRHVKWLNQIEVIKID